MASESGDTTSLWLATAGLPEAPRLERDVEADVCIVGAGIAGLSTAYELVRQGRSVVVIDQGRIGDGQTGRTTAHFTNAFDDRYHVLERVHGEEAARVVAASHSAAIERVHDIAARERIDCDLERLDGWLFRAPEDEPELLERELEAARRAGLGEVELRERAPLPFDTGSALRFPDQLELHPVKYLAGLARAIVAAGGRMHAHTHADTIEGGDVARIQTERGPLIHASCVVVATNTPVNDLGVIHTKQAAYQTYVIAARVPSGTLAHAMFWDTGDPYHYVRLQAAGPGEEFLIVGGEDHKTGQDDDPERRWTRLETWMRERFEHVGPVERRWSGEVMEPVDHVAFIGPNPFDHANVFVVTGDSGNGMTHGVIASLLLPDLIAGRANPWAELYDPARVSLRTVGRFLGENANAVRQYAAWLAPGDVASSAEIPRGEGALVRSGLKLVATYVDEQGGVHESSAACPHLGCVVRWNRAEKSWDCPCHGSRFDPRGRVVQGPAIVDLPRAEKAEHAATAAEARGEAG